MPITLYDYYRSTACYRVRIALAFKKIPYAKQEVHLLNHGGEHRQPNYLAINPQGLVPALQDNGFLLTQSLAILEYLEEQYPTPALLPADPRQRALARQMALTVACDIHPLNNLRVLNRLREQFGAEDAGVTDWYHHWLKCGFDAIEIQLQILGKHGPFCLGDQATIADICLVPQVYNAVRFGFSLADYPLIQAVNTHCLSLNAFAEAKPNL